jgi:hypothetical protein
MWIVLLDHSGSMGDPFGGEAAFAGRARPSEAATKLEAAKEALLADLSGLGPSTRIALIAFTEQPSLRFEGLCSQVDEIRTQLDLLHPEDGTDIGNALDFAARYLEGRPEDAGARRALVISDGLSDLADARAAAERLVAASSVVIDAILIDPSEEGEQVARAIAIDGRVDAVTSAVGLRIGVAAAAREQLKASGDPALVVEGFRQEAETVTGRIAPEEKVTFTAAYPGLIEPAQWYSLLVYCHAARLEDTVVELLNRRRGELGIHPATSTVGIQLGRGTLLRLTPRVEGIFFNPPGQEIAWLEDVHEVVFRFLGVPDFAGKTLLGTVEVHVGPVLVAQLPLSIRIRGEGDLAAEEEVRDDYGECVREDLRVLLPCRRRHRERLRSGLRRPRHLCPDRQDSASERDELA